MHSSVGTTSRSAPLAVALWIPKRMTAQLSTESPRYGYEALRTVMSQSCLRKSVVKLRMIDCGLAG